MTYIKIPLMDFINNHMTDPSDPSFQLPQEHPWK